MQQIPADYFPLTSWNDIFNSVDFLWCIPGRPEIWAEANKDVEAHQYLFIEIGRSE